MTTTDSNLEPAGSIKFSEPESGRELDNILIWLMAMPFMFIICYSIAIGAFAQVILPWAGETLGEDSMAVAMLSCALLSFTLTAGLAFLIGRFMGHPIRPRQLFKWKAHYAWLFLLGFPLVVALSMLANVIDGLSRGEIAGPSETTSALTQSSSLPYMLGAVFLAGIVVPFIEEVVFRGPVIKVAQTFQWKWAPYITAGLSIVLFTLGHNQGFDSLSDFMVLAGVGINAILFTWLALRTKSIWPSFMLHAGYNTTIMVIALFLNLAA